MNKPVAWTEKDLRNACRNARLSEDDFFRIKAYLPVDIHPVKELTDEEIKAEIGRVSSSYPTVESLIDFAKAILRKAQKK